MEEFAQVYEQLFPQVYRYLLSQCRDQELAEELTQETFVQALENIDGFRGECSLYVWLCQIGKNLYRSWLRRKERWKGVSTRLETGPFSHVKHVEDTLLDQESVMELHRRLHSLPEPYREVFSLRVFGELSYAQIAQLFEKSETWARVTYYRAKCKLKPAGV